MKNLIKKTLILSTTLTSVFAFEQSFEQRVQARFDHLFSSYDLRCELYDTSNQYLSVSSIGATRFENQTLSREFSILDSDLNTYTLQLEVGVREVASGNNGRRRRRTSYEAFYQAQFQGTVQTGLVQENWGSEGKKLIDLNGSLGTLNCFAEFANSEDILITDNSHHVNVHPLVGYDVSRHTEEITNRALSYRGLDHYVLLEDWNWRENSISLRHFLRTGELNFTPPKPVGSLLIEEIPDYVSLRVAAAGHNRYVFAANNKATVYYSGGNHNYCMWNNMRRLMTSVMVSEFSGELDVVFVTDAIVVQKRGIVSGLGWRLSSAGKDHRLSSLFENSSESRVRNYHRAYRRILVDQDFPYYAHRYARLTFNYTGEGQNFSRVFEGTGTRELTINFRYESSDVLDENFTQATVLGSLEN